MAFKKDELQALIHMVVAGGKSPATDGEGLIRAADLIRVIVREENQHEEFATQTARIAELEAKLEAASLAQGPTPIADVI